MYTLEDYLKFRGDLNFEASPVNEIDEMVFASMGKGRFSDVFGEGEKDRFSEVFRRFFALYDERDDTSLGLLESPILMRTLHEIAVCPRYADIEVSHFVNKVCSEETEQMSAMTVLAPNGRVYVTFRGTDDTLIGWKENCELAIFDSVPAQRDAADYLEKIASVYDGPIVILGHSKGGNLAVYAASNCSSNVMDRIEKVVSYDGPGFLGDFFEKPGYLKIKDRIITMVPTASIVGMIMNHAGTLDVISCEKEGPYAHDIFIWNLERDTFLRAPALSEKSLSFHIAMNQTLDEMSKDERKELVSEIFQVLSSTGAETLLDFTENSASKGLKIAAEFPRAREIQQFIIMISRHSLKNAMSNTIGDLQDAFKDKVAKPVKEKIGEFRDGE